MTPEMSILVKAKLIADNKKKDSLKDLTFFFSNNTKVLESVVLFLNKILNSFLRLIAQYKKY